MMCVDVAVGCRGPETVENRGCQEPLCKHICMAGERVVSGGGLCALSCLHRTPHSLSQLPLFDVLAHLFSFLTHHFTIQPHGLLAGP